MTVWDFATPDSALPCFKYFIFGFNFVTWCLGATLLTVGIIIRTDDTLYEYTKALEIQRYYISTYICMAIGALIIIISFIGCLGAAVESPCLLAFYVFITGICMALEVTCCVLVWKTAGGEALQAELTEQMLNHIRMFNTNLDSKRFMNLIQYRLVCCGARDRLDYENYGLDDPASCSSERTNNINIRSCGENLRRYLEKRGGAIGGISVGLLLLHIFSLGFNACLFWGLHQLSRYRY
ncbi:CD9 antigen [Tetranychus urticae]|uniref:Tetraspanin n=1 Tax=Tetranychus urticae TaxID=32264 RepID=T1KNU7_TETUR|nr:CD9 antigen [Tetranychus urticae]